MPPLLTLAAALVWNYLRSRVGKSTICSTTRKVIPARVFIAGWVLLTTWFIPHYCRPLWARKRDQ